MQCAHHHSNNNLNNNMAAIMVPATITIYVEMWAWHNHSMRHAYADHIVAVYQGGGLCDLENLRTLCVICHQVNSSLRV